MLLSGSLFITTTHPYLFRTTQTSLFDMSFHNDLAPEDQLVEAYRKQGEEIAYVETKVEREVYA